MLNGVVTIVGKPNVGKSTLFNKLLNKKVSIVSFKPQTTRNTIPYLYTDNLREIVLLDTPGYHKNTNKLDLFMNSEIKKNLNHANCVLFLCDGSRQIDENDLNLCELLKNYKVENIVLIITKIDISNTKQIEENKVLISKLINVNLCVLTSSISGAGLDKLLLNIDKFLSSSSQDLSYPNVDDKFLVKEIIREKIIFLTKQEIPYSVAVIIENMEYVQEKKLLDINALIVVEKNSQKPILIGSGGKMIKNIGIVSRKELLKIYDAKINLKLLVKVVDNWRNNKQFLKENGYLND